MNIQTEQLDDHTTRLTVQMDDGHWSKAKKQAARKIANQVKIPGFRKGKAPYRIIAKRFGEGAIIEEALDLVGNDVYRAALEESKIEPYGPGSVESLDLDEETQVPVFVFIVPLQPEVDLQDFRSVRRDFEAPEVTDEMVDQAMQQIRQNQALVEESHKPVEAGNRVTVDIHSEFVDGPEPPEDDDETADDDSPDESGEEVETNETESAEDEDSSNEIVAYKGDPFIHQHDMPLDLDPENEPIIPGIIDALVGSAVGDECEFELEIPDEEDYEDVVGRKVKFNVEIKKIENVTLPELNDDFAARITQDEDEPLTLLELRMKVREQLEQQVKRDVESEYAVDVLDDIVEQATIKFPEMMVIEQIDNMLDDLDKRLRQQGMTLDDYKTMSGKTQDDLYDEYRETAVKMLRRSLALGEIMRAENVTVPDSRIDDQIDKMVEQFGDQGAQFRSLLDTPSMRENITNDLMQELVMERVVQIGRGIEPEPPEEAVESEAEEATPSEVVASDTDAVEDVVAEAADVEEDTASEDLASDDEDAAADTDELTEEEE